MSVDNPSPAQEANTMVTETDRNKARSAVVSAYHALDCVTIPFPFLHAFADAAVDAVSTDAEPVTMDDEDRTPMPAGFDDALWRKADEVHHAMALVARDQECVKIIYAALSTHNAEPVKTAPAVAVKALEWKKTVDYNRGSERREQWMAETPWGKFTIWHYRLPEDELKNGPKFRVGAHLTPYAPHDIDYPSLEAAKEAAQKDYDARIRSALSAQVQDVAENDLAYKDARQLAMSLHAQHYSDVKQWKPLDDLRGVISQIDNMTCGLVAKRGIETQDDTYFEEIADGAWGDDPATRGRARDELAGRRAASKHGDAE